jgi:hypothetical protein
MTPTTDAERLAREIVAHFDEYGAGGATELKLARALLSSLAEVERLRVERDALRDALGQAAEWFGEYAASHEAKGAAEKAKRNQDRANFCGGAMIDAALKVQAVRTGLEIAEGRLNQRGFREAAAVIRALVAEIDTAHDASTEKDAEI